MPRAESYTNSSLTLARRCLTAYDLQYNLLLESLEDDPEVLQVGQAWHSAHHANATMADPYAAIARHAPGPKWNEKLRRMFACHVWYWQSQPLRVIKPEFSFRIEFENETFEGQIDGIVELEDGRRGVLEYKTTSDDIQATSDYWTRLRMDSQVGLYGMACGFSPDFILYDVARKPTIRPKSLTKAEHARMWKEIKATGSADYFGESFRVADIQEALDEKKESLELYGARLTADIGDRPDWYFARREVPRTTQDYETLRASLRQQIQVIGYAQFDGCMYRNTDACSPPGLSTCKFWSLCSNNVRPREGEEPPAGFRRRDVLHPELAR